jgi:hypothetical protein
MVAAGCDRYVKLGVHWANSGVCDIIGRGPNCMRRIAKGITKCYISKVKTMKVHLFFTLRALLG